MRPNSRKGCLVQVIRSIFNYYEFNYIDWFLICLVSIFNVLLRDDFSTHIDHRSACLVWKSTWWFSSSSFFCRSLTPVVFMDHVTDEEAEILNKCAAAQFHSNGFLADAVTVPCKQSSIRLLSRLKEPYRRSCQRKRGSNFYFQTLLSWKDDFLAPE